MYHKKAVCYKHEEARVQGGYICKLAGLARPILISKITNNSPLDMRPFVKNATFAFCDILNYPIQKIGAVLGEVYRLVE